MSYTVEITRENGDWLATVTDLEGVATWASTFTQLVQYVREAIALAEDLPEGAEETIDVEWVLPGAQPELAAALEVAQQRHNLVKAQTELEPKIAEAVSALTRAQWSTRDQAELFGMSAGRVSQIVKVVNTGTPA
ncbi:MAG TPA: hypothetical protein H9867_05725 [Candidatus Corynebacterium gallistercoris]|uniref:Antitoxin HicB n=1 Tax=Candidatus Corynebacterium gallistercoris TaxID=2838530 RepID=A0A9D1UQ11_9CORY|nr:hypothetical protein [Candidatus Corynebacterium gallistercoris]